LTETKAHLHEITNILFNVKFNYSKTFIDDNGKQKAFIIPMNENGGYDHMEFNDAANYCAKFDANLVEIQSQRKQSIFESFMMEIGEPFSNTLYNFWINGRRDSSGKFMWINSGNEFSYTNWHSKEPVNITGEDYVFVSVWSDEEFGKWGADPIDGNSRIYAICELQINK
jgi:hypothetical protein